MTGPDALVTRIRDLCLSLPEAAEKETWGHPTFRVLDKIFVMAGVSDDDGVTVSMKAAPGEQEALLAVGHPFFFPQYVGSKGWIGMHIDADTEWEEAAELVGESYRAIAPKRLSAQLDLSEE